MDKRVMVMDVPGRNGRPKWKLMDSIKDDLRENELSELLVTDVKDDLREKELSELLVTDVKDDLRENELSELLARNRFDSTVSVGRRIPSASQIDLSLAIPEDPLPSSTKGGGRR